LLTHSIALAQGIAKATIARSRLCIPIGVDRATSHQGIAAIVMRHMATSIESENFATQSRKLSYTQTPFDVCEQLGVIDRFGSRDFDSFWADWRSSPALDLQMHGPHQHTTNGIDATSYTANAPFQS
jgi:hypothetical protein